MWIPFTISIESVIKAPRYSQLLRAVDGMALALADLYPGTGVSLLIDGAKVDVSHPSGVAAGAEALQAVLRQGRALFAYVRADGRDVGDIVVECNPVLSWQLTCPPSSSPR